MSRQDNLASQERVVANGKHRVDTEKSLCTQGNGCVNTFFDWCTHRCIDTWFSCVRLCQEFFFSCESYFLNKNMFVVF